MVNSIICGYSFCLEKESGLKENIKNWVNLGKLMKLKKYPDPLLRRHALPLKRLTGANMGQLKEMLAMMYELEGIGLAGPQVGWNVRAIVLDTDGRGKGDRIFINPKIMHLDGMEKAEEGCLSLPGIRCTVERSQRVCVTAYNPRGQKLQFEAEGLRARAWQHEIDHLNGVLFIDKASAPEQISIRHRLKELRENA